MGISKAAFIQQKRDLLREMKAGSSDCQRGLTPTHRDPHVAIPALRTDGSEGKKDRAKKLLQARLPPKGFWASLRLLRTLGAQDQ